MSSRSSTRHWRTFAREQVYGEEVTCYGPIDRLRPGMLSFIDDHKYESRISSNGPAVVLCTEPLAEHVKRLGHIAVPTGHPRAEFWRVFERVAAQHIRGVGPEPCGARVPLDALVAPSAAVGSRPFKTYRDRLVPCLGSVYLGAGISIGEFTAIDAGIYGEDTEIRDRAHVDNLVHVGHSAIIGEGATIVAGAKIGGWAEIGAGAWIGLGALVRDSVKVGENAFVGMGAVVVKDVPPGVTVMGNPARPKEK